MDAQDDAQDSSREGQGTGHGGDARGYSWPPFEPGNEVATVHGAYSERRIAPLADQIAVSLLADDSTPQYIKEPSYSATVRAWSRAEATVQLLWNWLAEHDLDAALTDVTETDEDAELSKGAASKHTTSRHIESVLTQLHRHEVRAANLRSRLGLDPLSRARLGKDVAAQHVDLARMFAELQQDGADQA
jgi:hypothetical protein